MLQLLQAIGALVLFVSRDDRPLPPTWCGATYTQTRVVMVIAEQDRPKGCPRTEQILHHEYCHLYAYDMTGGAAHGHLDPVFRSCLLSNPPPPPPAR